MPNLRMALLNYANCIGYKRKLNVVNYFGYLEKNGVTKADNHLVRGKKIEHLLWTLTLAWVTIKQAILSMVWWKLARGSTST